MATIYKILFLISVALGAILLLLPWAEASPQSGLNSDQDTVHVAFLDPSVHGCKKGLPIGRDDSFCSWIGLGRVGLLGLVGLWSAVVYRAALVKGFRELAFCLVGLGLTLAVILFSAMIVVQFMHSQTPTLFAYAPHWHANPVSGSLLLLSAVSGTSSYILIRKIQLRAR